MTLDYKVTEFSSNMGGEVGLTESDDGDNDVHDLIRSSILVGTILA